MIKTNTQQPVGLVHEKTNRQQPVGLMRENTNRQQPVGLMKEKTNKQQPVGLVRENTNRQQPVGQTTQRINKPVGFSRVVPLAPPFLGKKRVSEGLIAWDEQTTLPGSARCELSGLIVNEMVPNRWHYQQRTPPAEKSGVAWSDASTTGWGYITKRKGEKRGVARYGMWEIEGCSGDMFFLEMLAAEKAVEALLLQGCRDLLVMVDNESVQYVVTRGHSKTRRGNQALRRVLARLKECNATLEVQWIPGGDDMPADCWSRMKAWGTKVVGVNLVGVLETERGFSAKKDS